MIGVSEVVGSGVFLRAGEGEPFWFLHNRAVVKATAESTGGSFGLLESCIPAGASPPLHVHHREDETFWVLEGTFTILCGDRTFRAGPGSYVFLPRDVPHGFVVEGPGDARLLTLLTPGGGEGFFVEAGRPAEGPGLPPRDPLDLVALERAAVKFGIELIGPPLRPGTGSGA